MLRKFISKHPVAVSMLGMFLAAHALDIISTELAMAFVKGSIEMNPLMRDPSTLKFVLSLGLQVKAITMLPALAFAAWGIAVEHEILGSIPMAWYTLGLLQVATSNFIMVWKG